MSKYSEKREKLLSHTFTEKECNVCMKNSLRLMSDAHFGNISSQTKIALLELSLEEAAKAFTILKIVRPGRKYTEKEKSEYIDEMVDSFQKHIVKVKVIKNLNERLINKVIPNFLFPKEYQAESKSRVGKILKGTSKETKVQVSNLIDSLSTEESMANFRNIMIRFIKILDEKKVDEIAELKNEAIYADLNEKGTEVVAPRYPDGNLGLGMILTIYSIGNAVFTRLNNSKGKEKIDGILRDIFQERIRTRRTIK